MANIESLMEGLAMSDSAVARFFALPELLEIALLNLPPRDILLCQRVSRSFRHTVASSILLRRAVFLEADSHALTLGDWASQKPVNNRLLLRAFPGCYPTISLARINDIPTMIDITLGRPGKEHCSRDLGISFPADKMPACHPAVDYPEASWRRMYLSQPPCTSLHLMRRWQRSTAPVIVREDGITMGDFVTEVTNPEAGWHERYISSDRDWHFECTMVS
ncbi:hypothetical protein NU219Hw_g7109t1 [Hortaea werneckii]